MDYVRIHVDGQGRSHFEDVHAETTEQNIVDGVPPVVLTGPFPATAVVFVELTPGGPEWEPHVAPRRQWVICLRGRVAITVSDGDRREFGAGEPILVEDVTGEGHTSTPLTDDFAFAMIPVGD